MQRNLPPTSAVETRPTDRLDERAALRRRLLAMIVKHETARRHRPG